MSAGKFVFAIKIAGTLFLVLMLSACTSAKKVNVPTLYRMKIEQIVLPLYLEHYCYQIYLDDTSCCIYEVVSVFDKKTKKVNKDTVYHGMYALIKDDIPIVDSTINILWANYDTSYCCPGIDANITDIELRRDETRKQITITGCEISDVDALIEILNHYCKMANTGDLIKTTF